MARILKLQALKLEEANQLDEASSTSSGHNCACSTASAVACIIDGEFMAI
jgi:hypothetical protein